MLSSRLPDVLPSCRFGCLLRQELCPFLSLPSQRLPLSSQSIHIPCVRYCRIGSIDVHTGTLNQNGTCPGSDSSLGMFSMIRGTIFVLSALRGCVTLASHH